MGRERAERREEGRDEWESARVCVCVWKRGVELEEMETGRYGNKQRARGRVEVWGEEREGGREEVWGREGEGEGGKGEGR